MLKIGLCDDSILFLQQVTDMIDKWEQTLYRVTVSTFCDADSLIQAHKESPFDIIFLDVTMPLLNGIDAAKEIRQFDTMVKIVFLTSSIEAAVDSYLVKASDYLLKPVAQERMISCLQNLAEEIYHNPRCILVKGMHDTYNLPVGEIAYLEAQGKHIMIALADGRTILTQEPLYSYEEKLTLEDGFYKCHRSFIINMKRIDSYTQKEVLLRDGQRIPISRSAQKHFHSVYFSVLFGKDGDF